MSTVSINEKEFLFTDYYGEQIALLDFADFPGDKSAEPFDLKELLTNTFNQGKKNLLYDSEPEPMAHLLLDGLLSAELISSDSPVKTVEIGCTDGRLSFHLAQILGRFDADSLLCLVDQEISNDRRTACLDTIAATECSPEIAVVFSDYDRTNLAENHFDYAVINGNRNYFDTAAVILEVERLVKEGGVIFCVCNHSPLLESTFKLIFPAYEALTITPDVIVLKAAYQQPSVYGLMRKGRSGI